VTHVIIYEGTNDLGDGATATELAAGLRRLAERAHARGVRVVGATIAPRQGTPTVPWDAAMEAPRQAVNGWIRSYPGWDGAVDIDRALQDPASPGQMRPEYDSGDGLHPGPAGRQAIADAVDLDLLRCVARPPETTLARRSVTYRRGRLLVRGASAADRCGGEPVRRVTVTLTKLGTRGPATQLRARGTEHWRLSRRIALRRGRYRVSARARTASLTESRSAANTVTLTVG
jgi:hypothetical protein